MAAPVIEELWIYPVKACRGIRVESAHLSATGFEFDRAWCFVDLDGVNVATMEAVSGRKLPVLATVRTSFSPDRSHLMLDAPGMPQLSVPVALELYEAQDALRVECSGRSTTSGGGWSFGFSEARCWPEGSAWISEYLNREDTPGLRVSGKSASRYGMARCVKGLQMSKYPPVLPLFTRAAQEDRFRGNGKQFADLSPLLLTSRMSAKFIGSLCPGGKDYPMEPFRSNIVVGGAPEAWDEETWRRIEISSNANASGEGIPLLKIKECARCTVPCRNAETGAYLFPKEPLALWKSFKKVFPRKFCDPEWGDWQGTLFGIYYGSGGREGLVRVGDSILVLERCRWDDHLGRCLPMNALAGIGLVLAASAAAAFFFQTRSRRSA